MARGGEDREVGAGDNSIDAPTLLSIVTRLETLAEDRRSIGEDVKQVKQEAKAAGFQLDVINFILKERRKDPDDVEEFNREVEKYRTALDGTTEHDL